MPARPDGELNASRLRVDRIVNPFPVAEPFHGAKSRHYRNGFSLQFKDDMPLLSLEVSHFFHLYSFPCGFPTTRRVYVFVGRSPHRFISSRDRTCVIFSIVYGRFVLSFGSMRSLKRGYPLCWLSITAAGLPQEIPRLFSKKPPMVHQKPMSCISPSQYGGTALS